jgi:hypothetical protein
MEEEMSSLLNISIYLYEGAYLCWWQGGVSWQLFLRVSHTQNWNREAIISEFKYAETVATVMTLTTKFSDETMCGMLNVYCCAQNDWFIACFPKH